MSPGGVLRPGLLLGEESAPDGMGEGGEGGFRGGDGGQGGDGRSGVQGGFILD